MIPDFLERAMLDVGVSEDVGSKNNARIVKMHSHTSLLAKDDETAWCASAMCCWLEESGLPSTRSAAAASYLTYGLKVEKPYLGCILVLERDIGKSHVCFYIGETSTHYWGLGGNQGNAVSYNLFLKTRLQAIRAPVMGTKL